MNDYLHIMQSRLTGNASRIAWLIAGIYGSRWSYGCVPDKDMVSYLSWALNFSKDTIKSSIKELERKNFIEIDRKKNGQIHGVRLILWEEWNEMQELYKVLHTDAKQ